MGWRDFKLQTPIDKIDKIDKTPLPEHPRTGFVDKVGFVDRVQSIKNPSPVHYKPSEEKPIWTNPYPKGSPEARRHTLSEVMDAMLAQIVIDFEASGYRHTPEGLQAECEAKKLYFAVLEGRKTLADFRHTIDAWELLVKQGVTI